MATNLVTGLGGPAGFGETALPIGDDTSSGFIDLRPVFPRGLLAFGTVYNGFFINTNGSITFGAAFSAIDLTALRAANGIPMIAPFLADVETGAPRPGTPGGSSTGSNRIWYNLDPAAGVATVTWDDVGFFSGAAGTPTNAFQLRLIAVPDGTGALAGDFDVEFRYESVNWSTGAFGGGGLNGAAARLGWSAGNGADVLELPASGDTARVLALDETSNAGDAGRYAFQSRGGRIAPVFSAESVRVAEGSAAAPGQALVNVTLSTPLAVPATVRYHLAPIEPGIFASATAGTDYVPRSGILTFAPGLTSQTVLVDLVGDDLPEDEEHFTLVLSQPSAGATAISGTIAIPAEDGATPLPIVLVSDAQASESAGAIDFVLRLAAPQAEAVSGFYTVLDPQSWTASAADVTVPETGFVSFAPGQTEVTVSIPVLPDTIVEGPEHFLLNFIIGAGGATAVRGTIRDDDGFSVSDAVVTEAGTTSVAFTVTLGGPLTEQANVVWSTTNGTAVAFKDFNPDFGQLTFAPGVVSQTVTVQILDDGTAEPDEQFSLELSGPSGNTGIADGTGIATIADTDGISIADLSVAENSNNTFNTAFMSVTLPQAQANQVTVDFQIEAGTGDRNSDISPNGHFGTLTFAPGLTKVDLALNIAGDSTPEPDETIRVVLSNAVGSTIADGSGTLTIINDDGLAPLVAAIASQTVTEGSDTGIQIVPMTVFLNRVSTQPVEIDWTLIGDNAGGGTASPGSDFVPESGTLTIPAGKLSATFPVQVVRDAILEPDETLSLRITKVTEGTTTLGTTGADATLTLTNDDTVFSQVLDVSVDRLEADWAAAPVTFTIIREGDLSREQFVGWEIPVSTTSELQAGASDFAATSGTFGFAPGQASATFEVQVLNDTTVERNEVFQVNLQLPPGGTAGTGVGSTFVIRNDDTSLNLLAPFSPYAGLESGFGLISTPRFHVEVDGNLGVAREVTWTITGSGPNPADAADFKAMTGTLAIPANSALVPLLIPVANDAVIEPSEGYTVTLSNAGKNVSFINASAESVIANDDYKAALSIATASQAEGSAGGSTAYAFTVTLDPAPPRKFVPTFTWKVGPGTVPGTISADAADFAGGFLPADTVAVGLNNATATIIVPVAHDTAAELNESFTLTLIDNASGLEVGKASAVILTDDAVLSIAATGANKPEGSGGGSTPFTFTVTRSGDLSRAHIAKWSAAGTAGTGTLPANAADFAGGALPAGTISFAVGQKTQVITVNVAADFDVESNERFAVTLATPTTGATLGTATAGAVILNDDTRFTLVAPATSLKETEWAAAPPSFTITRTGNLAAAQTVGWTADTGPSTTGLSDFNVASGTVSFAPGQTQATFKVGVRNDPQVEPHETFVLALRNLPAGATAADSTERQEILNDDASIILAPDLAGLEAAPGPTATVFVTGDLATSRTLTWTVAGDGATPANAADFAALTGTIAIPAGKSSVPLTIPVLNDGAVEPDEGYIITLSNPGPNATFSGAPTTTVGELILNDDATTALSAAKASLVEGTGGSTAYAFTVTLNPTPPRAFDKTYTFKVSGGAAPGTVSATAADFIGGVLPQGKVSVAGTAAGATFSVLVAADSTVEQDESFTVELFDGAALVGKASGTIRNDDALLSIAATSANKPEGSFPSPTPFTFTVTRTGDLSRTHITKWSASGITGSGTLPANAADFAGGVLPSGTITFAAGQQTQVITVNVAADRTVETNERFAVTLATPTAGATLGTATAGAVIQNDDAAGSGTLSVTRLLASRAEGQAGTTGLTFTVTRTGTTTGIAEADWTVVGGGMANTGAATASDFAGGVLPKGSITFAAGQTAKVVTVPVAGDAAIELNESFTLALSNLSQGVAVGTASATGLIWNDDTPGSGTLSIARLAAQKGEGAAGTTAFTFTVSRTGTIAGTASADWTATGGGMAGTNPANGTDFAGGLLPSGRVFFAAGQASTQITVNVAGDTATELNESFTVTLSGLQAGVTLGTASAIGTVLNDDFASTAGSEALSGTAGPDVFLLGGGVDTVLGKAGTDIFLFRPAALGDGVTNASFLGDFTGLGGERLDLSEIDAIAGGGTANDTFTFIGTAPFSAPGQIRWEDTGPLRAVLGSVDGDTTAELAIYLSAAGPVQPGWIVL